LIYTVQYNTLPQLPQRLSVIKNEKARRRIQERLMKGYALSEPYLRELAEKTGGRFYKADDLGDIGPAFEAITSELGVQYSLGYFHPVREADEPQSSILARPFGFVSAHRVRAEIHFLIARRSAPPLPRIEILSQSITDKVEGQNREGNREPRKD